MAFDGYLSQEWRTNPSGYPMATSHETTIPLNILHNSLPIGVKLSLTVVFTALYALLFLFIWIQLILILVYRHKRLSYQSVFLYLCLLWAALRTTLFSFYFNDSSAANRLPVGWKWLLYSLPIALQFFTLSLLALFFSQFTGDQDNLPDNYGNAVSSENTMVMFPFLSFCLGWYNFVLSFAVHAYLNSLVSDHLSFINAPQAVLKSLTTYEPHVRYRRRRYLFVVFGLVNAIFFGLNISDAILIQFEPCCKAKVVLVRVVINQMLFVITSFALCYCIIKLSRASTGNLLLEGQGTTLCQATALSIVIGLLYVSRAIYDIIAVSPVSLPSFGYGWINVSDEGEVQDKGAFSTEAARSYGFVSFGAVLFVWEFLPTFFVVVFFRVKRPQQGLGSILASGKENRRAYFFDNPRRYDSDDDLPATPQNISYDIPGMRSNDPYTINNSSLQRIHSYGSSGQQGFQRTGSYQGHMQGTTPTRLFSQGSSNQLFGTYNTFGQK